MPGHQPPKLSDADYEAILLAPKWRSHSDLAETYGVAPTTINSIRKRKSFRAMRIADRLRLDWRRWDGNPA